MPLKEGMKVTVFKDPSKETIPEAEVILTMRSPVTPGLYDNNVTMEMWYVQFPDGHFKQRLIKVQ